RCSCATRDLHSFPTRRSSDLIENAFAQYDGAFGVLAAFKCVDDGEGRARGKRIAAERRSVTADLEHLRRGAARQAGADGHAVAEDRKSTRLNSSHSQISYAVF